MGKIIDAHTHTFRYGEHWSEWAAQAYASADPVKHWLTGETLKPEDFHSPYEFVIEWMDKSGVDEVILLGNFQKPHGIAVPLEYMVEAKEAYPDRFHAFWCPDPAEPEKAREELEWAVKEKGFTGLKLLPTYNYIDPIDPRCRRLYQKASELGVPIVIHSGYGGYGRNNLAVWNEPHHMEPILIENPEINISFAHMGFHRIADTLSMMRRHPNLYGDLAYWYFYPMDFTARWLVFAKASGGFNRIMWGTDFHHVSMKADLEKIKRLPEYTREHNLEPFITEEDLELLLGKTAQQFLGQDV